MSTYILCYEGVEYAIFHARDGLARNLWQLIPSPRTNPGEIAPDRGCSPQLCCSLFYRNQPPATVIAVLRNRR